MSTIDLVWLIDLDPPSDVGGGRGFFPASDRTDPPDEALMRRRCDAVLEAVEGEAGGAAVVTVHTSPRHRETLLKGPYPEIWRRFREAGAALALHPHEERADGSTLYDDPAHLDRVIAGSLALAGAAGLSFDAFRSGLFAFHPALPAMLAEAGIAVDLSAAPLLHDPRRSIDWSAESARPDLFQRDGVPVAEVAIGWDGEGADLDSSYLFNERMDLTGLIRVWDRMRARQATSAAPSIVNFLCHGFGLADTGWRRQASAFLDHARRHGGRLVGIDAARSLPAAPAAVM